MSRFTTHIPAPLIDLYRRLGVLNGSERSMAQIVLSFVAALVTQRETIVALESTIGLYNGDSQELTGVGATNFEFYGDEDLSDTKTALAIYCEAFGESGADKYFSSDPFIENAARLYFEHVNRIKTLEAKIEKLSPPRKGRRLEDMIRIQPSEGEQ